MVFDSNHSRVMFVLTTARKKKERRRAKQKEEKWAQTLVANNVDGLVTGVGSTANHAHARVHAHEQPQTIAVDLVGEASVAQRHGHEQHARLEDPATGSGRDG